MDFRNLFKRTKPSWGSNLTVKIGNPPKLKIHSCYCMWSDLLGFGKQFEETNWNVDEKLARNVYNRLVVAHSAALYYSMPFEKSLILNDGIAKVYRTHSNWHKGHLEELLEISLFIRECVQLHISINETETENGYPGCRSVLTFGDNVEYLADEVRFDDYVLNYTKPQGAEISSIARDNGNPIVIYNPKELQMNTAFSKAFLLDEGGSKIGLPSKHFYIDSSVITEIERLAKKQNFNAIWDNTNDGILFYIPRKDTSSNVLMGFLFSEDVIRPDVQLIKYSTTVYRLLRFYPHDENPNEFSFNLEDI